MKKILILTLLVIIQLTFAGTIDNCPRVIKVQEITLNRYNPNDWNPKPIGDTGVIKTQRLFAEFLEGTVRYKLKRTTSNKDICNYTAAGKNNSFYSKINLNLDFEKNSISYLVTLKQPTLDGWNALIQQVGFVGNFELKKNVITVLEKSTGYSIYSGQQWWGSDNVIFEGVREGKFKI